MRNMPSLAAALLLATAGTGAGQVHAGIATDPVGDTLGLGVDAPDVLAFKASRDSTFLVLRLDFAAPPGDLAGLFELDTDADPTTGAISNVAFLCPEAVAIGVEYTVDLFNTVGTTASVRDAQFAVVGHAATRKEGSSLFVEVPLHLIGGAGTSALHAAAVVGPRKEASDCVPDGKFLVTIVKQETATPIPVLDSWWAALLMLLIAGQVVRSVRSGQRHR